MANNNVIGPGRFPQYMYFDRYYTEIMETGEVNQQIYWYIKIRAANYLYYIFGIEKDKQRVAFSDDIKDTYRFKFKDELTAITIANAIKMRLKSEEHIEAEVNVVPTSKFCPNLEIDDSISNDKLCEIFECDRKGLMRISQKNDAIVVISCNAKWKENILYFTGLDDYDTDKLEENINNRTLFESKTNNFKIYVFEEKENIYTYCGIGEFKDKYHAAYGDKVLFTVQIECKDITPVPIIIEKPNIFGKKVRRSTDGAIFDVIAQDEYLHLKRKGEEIEIGFIDAFKEKTFKMVETEDQKEIEEYLEKV